MLWNSGIGNTYKQRSCPLVITTPPASSSRNLAGRISRPLSSRRGVWVPRNIGRPPPCPSGSRSACQLGPAGLPDLARPLALPLRSTLLHFPPPASGMSTPTDHHRRQSPSSQPSPRSGADLHDQRRRQPDTVRTHRLIPVQTSSKALRPHRVNPSRGGKWSPQVEQSGALGGAER